jgi:hypothetical protein
LALVVAVVDESVADAPLELGAVKVTVAFGTGLPRPSATATDNDCENGLDNGVVCGLPPAMNTLAAPAGKLRKMKLTLGKAPALAVTV